MKNRYFYRIFSIICLCFLFMSNVSAADTLKDKGIKINSQALKALTINVTGANYGGVTTTEKVLNEGDVYNIVYPNAFTYNNKTIKIELRIELLHKNSTEKDNTIAITQGGKTADGLIETWAKSELTGTKSRIKVNYTFRNASDNSLIDDDMVLFLGIVDPDYGSFYFNPEGKTIYYTMGSGYVGTAHPEYTFDEWFKVIYTGNVAQRGIIRSYDDSVIVNFDDPTIVIPIKGPYFEYEYDGINCSSGGERVVQPVIYYGEFNIYYRLNDSPEEPATNDPTNPTTYVYGNEKNILDPTREGYIFLGWEKTNESDEPESGVQNKVTAIDFGDKTFTAKWEKIYNIIYDLNDSPDSPATNDPTNPTTYRTGDEKDILEPTREGYVFKGWIKSDVDDNPEDGEQDKIIDTDSGDKKFTAVWERKRIITTEVKNGDIDDGAIVDDGDNITIKYKPKPGYVLKTIMIDGVEVDISDKKDSYSFIGIDEDHSIYVEYEIDNPQTGSNVMLFIFPIIVSAVLITLISKKEILYNFNK